VKLTRDGGHNKLGGMPEDWQVQRLANIGDTYGGLTGKTKRDFGAGDGRFVTFMNVMSNVVIDCDSFERVRVDPREAQNRVRQNDILFNGSSETPEEVGLCAVHVEEVPGLFLNSFCFGFRCRAEAESDPLFLVYLFRSDIGREVVKSLAQGSTRYNISKTALLNAPFPAPPLSEQREIAAALSDVDALLDGLYRLIAKKRDIKHAAMHQLLTGKTRLPGFCAAWNEVSAGDIGRFRGGSGFPTTFQGTSSGRYPFFKVSDMNNSGNETFMETANNYIGEVLRKQLRATAFPAGSIVFAKIGAAVFLERKKILVAPSCLDNNMAAFIIDSSRGHHRFLHYVLLSTKLGELVSTTALPSLSGSVLAAIRFLLPPLPEQAAIADVLADMDAELSALEARRDKTVALKQGMMQELLTGRTRLLPSNTGSAADAE
jgi:type I restriction enzyme, S subunit